MVNATELRIGNWIKLGNDYAHVYQIFYHRINGYSINHIDYKEEFFEPIPLTNEILEKCGFEYYKDNGSYQLDTDLGFSLWSDGKNGEVNVFCESDELGNSVKYLHQLQNLYFSLTGKELEINL